MFKQAKIFRKKRRAMTGGAMIFTVFGALAIIALRHIPPLDVDFDQINPHIDMTGQENTKKDVNTNADKQRGALGGRDQDDSGLFSF